MIKVPFSAVPPFVAGIRLTAVEASIGSRAVRSSPLVV